jgi:hypothetical protein
MRLRDSGMPDESYWETLFDVPLILNALGIDRIQVAWVRHLSITHKFAAITGRRWCDSCEFR